MKFPNQSTGILFTDSLLLLLLHCCFIADFLALIMFLIFVLIGSFAKNGYFLLLCRHIIEGFQEQ